MHRRAFLRSVIVGTLAAPFVTRQVKAKASWKPLLAAIVTYRDGRKEPLWAHEVDNRILSAEFQHAMICPGVLTYEQQMLLRMRVRPEIPRVRFTGRA